MTKCTNIVPKFHPLWSLLTVGVYGVGVEERPVLAAAAVGSTLGVLTPNPVELLVEADDDLVKEPVFKVFVASAVDGWAARKSVLHPEGPGKGGHNGGGVVLGAGDNLVSQEGCHVVLAVQVKGLFEVEVFIGHAAKKIGKKQKKNFPKTF